VADYLGVDVTIVRLLWVILSIVPGALVGGAIAYAAAWLLMPETAEPLRELPEQKQLRRSFSDRKIAGVCGGVAHYFGIDATIVRLAAVVLAIYPGAIICGVIVYAAAVLVIPPEPPSRLEVVAA
jgi:phage shock protein PspC (stress-responsive transcriptional regulator)